MLASLASLVLLASSALAVSITDISGWTSTGPNEVKFSVVSTDPTSFQVVLVNQNTSLLSSSVVLVKEQSASAGSLSVTPCGTSLTSFPVGSGYQVNFVNSTSSAIVTQSNQFNITQGSGTSSCASSTTAAASSTAGSAGASASAAVASASSTAATGAAFSTSSLGTTAALLAALGLVGATLL